MCHRDRSHCFQESSSLFTPHRYLRVCHDEAVPVRRGEFAHQQLVDVHELVDLCNHGAVVNLEGLRTGTNDKQATGT